jgi:hypothetical protein
MQQLQILCGTVDIATSSCAIGKIVTHRAPPDPIGRFDRTDALD